MRCEGRRRIANTCRTAIEAIRLAKALEMPILNMHLSSGVYFRSRIYRRRR